MVRTEQEVTGQHKAGAGQEQEKGLDTAGQVCIGCGWCCFPILLLRCGAPSLPPWRLLSPSSFGWWCFPFTIKLHGKINKVK